MTRIATAAFVAAVFLAGGAAAANRHEVYPAPEAPHRLQFNDAILSPELNETIKGAQLAESCMAAGAPEVPGYPGTQSGPAPQR